MTCTKLLLEELEQYLSDVDNIKNSCQVPSFREELSGAPRKKAGTAKGFSMENQQHLTYWNSCTCDVTPDMFCVLPGLIRMQLLV